MISLDRLLDLEQAAQLILRGGYSRPVRVCAEGVVELVEATRELKARLASVVDLRDADGRALLRERARIEEALPKLADAIELAGLAADPDQSYGNFHGGDPRDFRPDEECSTEEERARWAADCARWNEAAARGETPTPEDGPHVDLVDGGGKWIGYATRSGYGLGTNTSRDEDAERLAALLAEIFNTLGTPAYMSPEQAVERAPSRAGADESKGG